MRNEVKEMKNFWLRKWTGYVIVEIKTKYPERVLNQLFQSGTILWNVSRISEELIRFSMFMKDHHKLDEIEAKEAIEIHFMKPKGLPVWLSILKNNIGFLVGAFIALLFLFILSNMIWNVEIRGASPALTYKIEKQLKELGVRIGGLQFFVDPPEVLQEKITKMNEEITWIGVNIHGTSYSFQVVEKEQPEKEKPLSPRNLVAAKEAVIVDYFVEKGKPLIAVNDYVKPGQILVSGLIGNDNEQRIIPAKGVVLGKTWYKTETEVNMKTKKPVLTGKTKNKNGIKIGSLYIPIWGFGDVPYKDTKVEEEESKLKIFNKTLPFSFVQQSIKEVEYREITYTKEEAKKLALEISKKDLLRQLPEDSKIIGEKILHERIDNGKFKIAILYDVVENIATEQPIIQSN